MSDRLVSLTFSSHAEAALARNILVQEGIPVQFTQEMATWALSGMFDNVRLLVNESDLEKAEQLIDEALRNPLESEDELPSRDDESIIDFADSLADCSPPPQSPAWKCTSCGVRVSLDERRCWSCGTSQIGELNPYFVRAESTISGPPDIRTRDNDVPEHVGEVIDRAWRAACLGLLVVFPLAHLYSAWLLVQVAGDAGYLTGRLRRRFYFAFVIDAFVLGVTILLVAMSIRR